MPNETKKKTEKSNVVPLKAPRPKPERLNALDRLVLTLVRRREEPTMAYEFDRPPAEGAVEASLEKLERLGHIKKATGYVATARGPVATPEFRADGVIVWSPYDLADEFGVLPKVAADMLARVGIPSEGGANGDLPRDNRNVLTVDPKQGISLARAFVIARIFDSVPLAEQMLERGEALLSGKREVGGRVLVVGERHVLSYRDRRVDITIVPEVPRKAG